jgi:predicted Zn-dependent peptidase
MSAEPEILQLSNGVRLIVDAMPAFETAAIGIWVEAGAMDERPAEHGAAHLLEHMAFKGTRRRGAREIAEAIEGVGGYLNAMTGYQRTGYYARVLSDHAPLAVDILCDIVSEPTLDPGELAKEQDVVIQEIGEAADQPDDVADELVHAHAFAGQGIGRPILGTPETVAAQTPASLRAFMARLYTREQLVIAAAGGVDADRLAREIEARLPSPSPRAAGATRDPIRFVGGAAHDDRDSEQCHVAAAFPAIGAGHPDYFAALVFVEALGGGMASRLFQTIREDRGLAYSVYAAGNFFAGGGYVGVYLGVDGKTAEEATGLTRREIEAMANAVTPQEIARAKSVLKAGRIMTRETPAGRMETAAQQWLTFGRLVSPAEAAARLDAVSAEDVRRCAARALGDGPPALAVVGQADFEGVRRALVA